jgi:uncharacterized membrane protein YozB (DUF420 family)
MKEKITAVISFIGSLVYIVFGLISIFKGDIGNLKEAVIMSGFMLFFVSTILYIIWTGFGKGKLRKQIQ